MIYTIKDGKLVPSVAKSGKRYKPRSKQQKHHANEMMKRTTYYDFYKTNRWKRLSKSIRRSEPLCRICMSEYRNGKRKLGQVHLADSVDHIKPLKTKDGYRQRWKSSNLQPLCQFHHAYKSKVLNL